MTSAELTIAEVAERTGLTRHTLRYYERDGLMLGVGRAGSGHRRYSDRDLTGRRDAEDRSQDLGGGRSWQLFPSIRHDTSAGGIRSASIMTVTITHAPPGYQCPFCALTAGVDTDCQQDIVRRTAGAMAFISPRWWPNNHGHVPVVPIRHCENLYGLSADAGHAVHDLVPDVAIAIRRTYGCEGVSQPHKLHDPLAVA
jgi:MerR HTH family regulatory protein